MTTRNNPLFRAEVSRRLTDRLHGGVNIATPVGWHIFGYVLFATVVAMLIFLCRAPYARTETVQGIIALDKGVAVIVPSRPGVISAIQVVENQHVRAGQKLASVRAEESLDNGGTAPERVRQYLGQQDIQLAEQSSLLAKAAEADRARLAEQIAGHRSEIAPLASQIADQKELLAVAEKSYRDALVIAKQGFISRRDIETRETTILSRRQQLEQLKQAYATKRADIAQAQQAMVQADMAAQAQMASARSGRAALSQQLVQAELARGYAVTSPVEGVVTALTARVGQPAISEKQLMLVVPIQAQKRVELYVPTAAAGFIAPGQEIRVSIDAFPYQTFGTLKGRITDVSQAAIPRQAENGTIPVYLVAAALPQPWIDAFGRRQPLLPGMTLTARIVTERRSLMAWLFEPLLAVRRR